MGNTKKSFLIGCLLGLIPVLIYGHFKFKQNDVIPSYDIAYENPSYLSSDIIKKDLEITTTPTPTFEIKILTPTPTQRIIEKEVVKTESVKANTSKHVEFHTPDEVRLTIEKYANEYGVNKEIMLIIAKCESGFKANATNGSFGGIYQFLTTTWVSNRKAMGLDPDPNLRFNADEAVKTAAFKMAKDGFGAWPACSQKAFRSLNIASKDI